MKVLTMSAVGLLVLLFLGAGCTIEVPYSFSVDAEGAVDGFERITLDLSDSSDFQENQGRIKNLKSATLELSASNGSDTEQTLTLYISRTSTYNEDNVAESATLVGQIPVPAGADNQQYSEQLGSAALSVLNAMLSSSQPTITVYLVPDQETPDALSVSDITVNMILQAGLFRIRAAEPEPECEFIPWESLGMMNDEPATTPTESHPGAL